MLDNLQKKLDEEAETYRTQYEHEATEERSKKRQHVFTHRGILTRSTTQIGRLQFQNSVLRHKISVFVERSSTIERTCQPPKIWKQMQTFKRARACKNFNNFNNFTVRSQLYILFTITNQASLNHRANACSCL
jgi:hypothetical protein